VTEAAVIAVRALTKAFGARPVLHGIDLDLRRGEFLGLVGPNGAGKSTLLRILIGLYRRSAGDVRVFGLDPATDSLAIRARCSYLPGETSVYLQMTGREFLAFAQSFQRQRDDVLRQRLEDLFALPLERRVRSYSAGMKQKLAILAALSAEAELYLLDEPDRALDATMRAELRVVLQELHRAGRTIVLSSHHLEELQELATRLEFLRDGRLVPAVEVERARSRLLHRFRVRLAGDRALPPGCRELQRDADGMLVLESDGPPLQWLRQLDPAEVRAAEIGHTRLEDLYQLLFLPHLDAAGASAADAAAARATR
jgi:ABC-2 type transport system ATP-binding protein